MCVEDYRAMSANEIHAHLDQLLAERVEARETGLADVRLYMADLEREIAECRRQYVLTALGEIASLRGSLMERQWG
jgi:uncharacterized protein involved in cysteine biosynthesis